ncbi:MAG: hypothetical protein J0I52_02415 [Bordetella sp.]|nr:hypothetical protein [Bordetella sp.]
MHSRSILLAAASVSALSPSARADGPIAAWTLPRPTPDGRRAWPLIGLGVFGVALLFPAAAEWPTHEMETPITVTGGLLLGAAHLMN